MQSEAEWFMGVICNPFLKKSRQYEFYLVHREVASLKGYLNIICTTLFLVQF